jgi:hypothetical protein
MFVCTLDGRFLRGAFLRELEAKRLGDHEIELVADPLVSVVDRGNLPLERFGYVAQVGLVRVVVERPQRQLGMPGFHYKLSHQQGVLRY